jgi:hypothetical protein
MFAKENEGGPAETTIAGNITPGDDDNVQAGDFSGNKR